MVRTISIFVKYFILSIFLSAMMVLTTGHLYCSKFTCRPLGCSDSASGPSNAGKLDKKVRNSCLDSFSLLVINSQQCIVDELEGSTMGNETVR